MRAPAAPMDDGSFASVRKKHGLHPEWDLGRVEISSADAAARMRFIADNADNRGHQAATLPLAGAVVRATGLPTSPHTVDVTVPKEASWVLRFDTEEAVIAFRARIEASLAEEEAHRGKNLNEEKKITAEALERITWSISVAVLSLCILAVLAFGLAASRELDVYKSGRWRHTLESRDSQQEAGKTTISTVVVMGLTALSVLGLLVCNVIEVIKLRHWWRYLFVAEEKHQTCLGTKIPKLETCSGGTRLWWRIPLCIFTLLAAFILVATSTMQPHALKSSTWQWGLLVTMLAMGLLDQLYDMDWTRVGSAYSLPKEAAATRPHDREGEFILHAPISEGESGDENNYLLHRMSSKALFDTSWSEKIFDSKDNGELLKVTCPPSPPPSPHACENGKKEFILHQRKVGKCECEDLGRKLEAFPSDCAVAVVPDMWRLLGKERITPNDMTYARWDMLHKRTRFGDLAEQWRSSVPNQLKKKLEKKSAAGEPVLPDDVPVYATRPYYWGPRTGKLHVQWRDVLLQTVPFLLCVALIMFHGVAQALYRTEYLHTREAADIGGSGYELGMGLGLILDPRSEIVIFGGLAVMMYAVAGLALLVEFCASMCKAKTKTKDCGGAVEKAENESCRRTCCRIFFTLSRWPRELLSFYLFTHVIYAVIAVKLALSS